MRRVFNLCLLTVLFVLSSISVSAVPADSRPKQIRQKDGTTITVITYGDEFYHYTTTADGILVSSVDGIYQYATVDAEGRITALGVNAKNPSLRTSADNAAVAQASRGVPQHIFEQVQRKRRAELIIDSPFTLDKMKNEGGQSRAGVKQEKVIVLLAQFTDVKFTVDSPRQAFSNMLNQEGYSKNGATGSARDYYYQNSNGQYDLQMDVVGPYTLPHNMAYYGGNDDANADQMIIDVCEAADPEVDFTEYATGDQITRLFVYYAGYNEAEQGPADSVWPHRSVVMARPTFDGVKLYDYACSSELRGSSGTYMAHIGTFCHEYGHCIGLADYYNTIGGAGTVNLGTLSLMSAGNYNNNGATPPELSAYDKSFLGWLELKQMPTSGKVTMEPLNENVGYYIPTSVDGEYFVFENRDMTYKWNKYIAGGAPSNGMFVYHVDESSNFVAEAGTTARQLWQMNRPNAYASHECFKAVRAETTNENYPHMWMYPGSKNHTTLSSTYNNEFKTWAGGSTGYTFTNIATKNGNVTFDVTTSDGQVSIVVTNQSGAMVSGATVTLIESSIVKGMNTDFVSLEGGTRATSGYYSTTTGSNGKAVFNLTSGEYKVLVGKSGLGSTSDDIKVVPGTTTMTYKLGNQNVGGKVTYYNYSDNPALVFSNGVDKSRFYGIQFTYDEVKSTTSTQRIVSTVVAPKNERVKVAIKKNSDEPIIKEYTVGSSGLVDLTEHNVVIANGDEVIVGVNNFSGWLDIDNNPEWGRNLISSDGDNWQYMGPQYGGNVAWDITVGFADYKDDATSMNLTTKTYNLSVGEVEKLAYTFSPSGTTGIPTWKSSDEKVAVVDEGGILRVVGAGNATITASLGSKAASGSVTVNATAEVTLKEPVVDRDANTATISWTPLKQRKGWSLYYKSNIDTKFTQKDFDANVTSYTIEHLYEGATYEVYLSSKHDYLPNEIWGAVGAMFAVDGELVEPESVAITGYEEVMHVDESVQLSAVVSPDGTYDTKVTWTIAPSNLATIDEDGVLTAKNGGEVTVTATTAVKKLTASVKITIKNAVSDIVVEPYQNDAIILWEGKGNKWQVSFSQVGGGLQKTVEVNKPMFHIDCLKPNTEYTATITPYVNGQLASDKKQTVSVKTTANVNGYSSITAKGEYSASDSIPLRVADIQGTQESIEWYIDGKQVNPPTAKLSAGRHKIEAVVKTTFDTEKIIKFVTVK